MQPTLNRLTNTTNGQSTRRIVLIGTLGLMGVVALSQVSMQHRMFDLYDATANAPTLDEISTMDEAYSAVDNETLYQHTTERTGVQALQQQSAFRNGHALCQKLTSTSASRLWTEWAHQEDFLNASTYGQVRDETKNLLLDMTPTLLKRGLMSRPRQKDFERVWLKWQTQQEQRQNNLSVDPIRILVMGGSVTEGSGCKQTNELQARKCNWSSRLEHFVNTLMGYEAIKVYNIANGGTHTGQGLSLLKYSLLPDDLLKHFPDIIINAYGMNDSHLGVLPPTEWERIKEVAQNTLERSNAFLNTLQVTYPCPTTRPVLLYLDDYYGGHGDGGVVGDAAYRMILNEFSMWNSLGVVSSARVKQPLVYPDPVSEKAVSPNYRWKHGNFIADVHFNYLGHQVIVWTWMYAILEMAVGFCEDRDVQMEYGRHSEQYGNQRESFVTEQAHAVAQKEHEAPPFLLDSQIQDLGSAWKQSIEKESKDIEMYCSDDNTPSSPCLMAWIAGPEGKTSLPRLLQNYLGPFMKLRQKWGFEADLSHGWSRRLGMVAHETGAKFIIQILNITQPANMLTAQYLKSYGEAWEGSRLMLSIQSRPATSNESAPFTTVQEQSLVGIHNSTTSISYTDDILLNISAGHDLRVVGELVNGTNFKFTGMMLCSR